MDTEEVSGEINETGKMRENQKENNKKINKKEVRERERSGREKRVRPTKEQLPFTKLRTKPHNPPPPPPPQC